MTISNIVKYGSRLLSIAVVLLLFRHSLAGLCCQSQAGCSGCIQVTAGPPGYVKAGNNTVKNCLNTQAQANCSEGWDECASITDGSLYSAGCTNVIGTITVGLFELQCGDFDDACSGG